MSSISLVRHLGDDPDPGFTHRYQIGWTVTQNVCLKKGEKQKHTFTPLLLNIYMHISLKKYIVRCSIRAIYEKYVN